MAKLAPEERWRRHIYERLIAFSQSGELDRLRKKGLAILGRKNRYTRKVWAKSPMEERLSRPGYKEWHGECVAVANKFGLAEWTVVSSCLISRYEPMKMPFPVERKWLRVSVVTENHDDLFLRWLSYEANRLGIHVIVRTGDIESRIVNYFPPEELLPLSKRPPWRTAFLLRVETPPDYPTEAARDIQKESQQRLQELLRRLGYRVPKRQRHSPLVSMAKKLRVSNKPLASGQAYEIMDDIYPGIDPNKEQNRRRLIASRRSKINKRLKAKDDY